MKNIVLGFAVLVPLLFTYQAFGSEGGMDTQSVKYLAYFFAMAIAASGPIRLLDRFRWVIDVLTCKKK